MRIRALYAAPMPDAPPRPEPFTPQTDPATLNDLRTRLRATRWPDAPEEAAWSVGADIAYLRELVAYWADGFDWLAQEAALARLSHFRVALGGLGIHFVHVRAAGPPGLFCRWSSAMAGRIILAVQQGRPPPYRSRRARR